MRVELCNKPARHDQGRCLVLDQVRHQLNDCFFDLFLKFELSVPRNSGIWIPLCGDSLCIESHCFLRPNLRLLSQLERKLWCPSFHGGPTGGQTPAAWRFFDHSPRLVGIRVASTFGSFPSSSFNSSCPQVEPATLAGQLYPMPFSSGPSFQMHVEIRSLTTHENFLADGNAG